MSELTLPRPAVLPAVFTLPDDSSPGLVRQFEGRPLFISVKLVGIPVTIFNTDHFGVCVAGHELPAELRKSELAWKMVDMLGLEAAFLEDDDHYVLEAVLVGPGVRGNPHGLKQPVLYGYDLFDLQRKTWEEWPFAAGAITQVLKMPIVPAINLDTEKSAMSLDQLRECAASVQFNKRYAPGIVVRPILQPKSKRLWMQVANPGYVLPAPVARRPARGTRK